MKIAAKTGYSRISPGQRGYLWREQKLNDCIALGWSETGSAKGKGQAWLRRRLRELEWPGKRAYSQLADFIWNVQKGHKVVASTSGRGIYALGMITGDYEFDKRLEYQHSRKVTWETTFWDPVGIDCLHLTTSFMEGTPRLCGHSRRMSGIACARSSVKSARHSGI